MKEPSTTGKTVDEKTSKTNGDKTAGEKTTTSKTNGGKTVGEKTTTSKTNGDKTAGEKTTTSKTNGDKTITTTKAPDGLVKNEPSNKKMPLERIKSIKPQETKSDKVDSKRDKNIQPKLVDKSDTVTIENSTEKKDYGKKFDRNRDVEKGLPEPNADPKKSDNKKDNNNDDTNNNNDNPNEPAKGMLGMEHTHEYMLNIRSPVIVHSLHKFLTLLLYINGFLQLLFTNLIMNYDKRERWLGKESEGDHLNSLVSIYFSVVMNIFAILIIAGHAILHKDLLLYTYITTLFLLFLIRCFILDDLNDWLNLPNMVGYVLAFVYLHQKTIYLPAGIENDNANFIPSISEIRAMERKEFERKTYVTSENDDDIESAIEDFHKTSQSKRIHKVEPEDIERYKITK